MEGRPSSITVQPNICRRTGLTHCIALQRGNDCEPWRFRHMIGHSCRCV